jgi:hypothetical protein
MAWNGLIWHLPLHILMVLSSKNKKIIFQQVMRLLGLMFRIDRMVLD